MAYILRIVATNCLLLFSVENAYNQEYFLKGESNLLETESLFDVQGLSSASYDNHVKDEWLRSMNISRVTNPLLLQRSDIKFLLDSVYIYTQPNSGPSGPREASRYYDYVGDSLDVSLSWSRNQNSGEFTTGNARLDLHDSEGRVKYISVDLWNGHYDNWNNYIKAEGVYFVYNEKDQLTTVEIYYTDLLGTIQSYITQSLTYNGSDQLARVDFFTLTNISEKDTIVPVSIINYKYDGNGNLQSSQSDNQDFPSLEWRYRDSIAYKYDNKNRITTMERYVPEAGKLLPFEFEDCSYLPDGRIDHKILHRLYKEGMFKDRLVQQYLYHSYGSLSEIFTTRIYEDNPPIPVYRTSYFHDSEIPIEDAKYSRNLLLPDLDYEQHHMLLRVEYVNLDLEWELRPDGIFEFFYRPANPVATESVRGEDNSYLLYPNPVYDVASILWDNQGSHTDLLSVYDVKGRKELSVSLDNRLKEIDFSQLNSGLYFYEVSDGLNQLVTDKFIKL